MRSAYIVSAAAFYPGEPVDNNNIDRYIAPLDAKCTRTKRRILAENGIERRHYAIDEAGRSRFSVAQMGAHALHIALDQVGCPDLDFLAAATTGSDVSVPGFANMLQGQARLRPLKTASVAGVCASSIGALDYAVHEVRQGLANHAAVVASEFPSRLFKKSRLRRANDLSFDAHFLRWMLSDGAGAWVLGHSPVDDGISLQVDFVHLKSFSGDYPTCMQVGLPEGNEGAGYLDYDSLAEAEEQGAYLLRQDIRLLPNLFDVGIHEYSDLVRAGYFEPTRIDHFLGHYSSRRFRGVMRDLMDKAGLLIPEDRWYSNLTNRGNMGSASIVTMLADFLREREVKHGEQLLLFVPESGRFTIGFVGLTAVDSRVSAAPLANRTSDVASRSAPTGSFDDIPAPVATHANPEVAAVLRELLSVWHRYRSDALRSDVARRVFENRLSREDYCTWMAGWIGQVQQGSRWMRAAAAHLPPHLSGLAALIEHHAGEEQNDWQVLYADYLAAGGTIKDVAALRMNPGAHALNAYMHRVASSAHADALLGAVYIIEGTGNRIVPTLLPRIKAQLGEALGAYRFLEYHGENDVAHMQRWLCAVEIAVTADPGAGERIVQTASDVAGLYAMSWACALYPQD